MAVTDAELGIRRLKGRVVASTLVSAAQRYCLWPFLIHTETDLVANSKLKDTTVAEVPASGSLLGKRSIPVSLDTHAYHVQALSDDEVRQPDLRRFTQGVIVPQARAFGEAVDLALASAVQSTDVPTVIRISHHGFTEAVKQANRILDARWLPNDPVNRFVVVGSKLASLVKPVAPSLLSPDVVSMRLIGIADGLSVFVDWNLPDTEGYVFDRTAWTAQITAPAAPLRTGGVFNEGRAESKRLALRWFTDYDTTILQDRSVVDAFVGARPVLDDEKFFRAVKVVL